MIIGNGLEAVDDEKSNTGRDFVNLLKQNTQGGSLWYLRAANERVVLDQLQQQLDPQAR